MQTKEIQIIKRDDPRRLGSSSRRAQRDDYASGKSAIYYLAKGGCGYISRCGYTNRRYFYLSNRIKAELSFCNATIFHDSTFNVTVDTSCNFGIIL